MQWLSPCSPAIDAGPHQGPQATALKVTRVHAGVETSDILTSLVEIVDASPDFIWRRIHVIDSLEKIAQQTEAERESGPL
jgi:hypothetical protein